MSFVTQIRIGIRKRGDRGEYIGRACYGCPTSPLANPFHIGRDGSREVVIARYETWLRERISAGDRRPLGELRRLLEIARRGPLTLVCWCAPAACHGEVGARVLAELRR